MTEPDINREFEPFETRVDKLINVMQQMAEQLQIVTVEVNKLQDVAKLHQDALMKHEKAIGLLLKEVKDLKDKANKPLIYKP